MGAAGAVLDDLQGAHPIAGLQVIAAPIADLSGLTLGVVEQSRVHGELAQLPDELDPNEPTAYGGGNWVPRSLVGPELLVLVADILQEDLAETAIAWGEARPPCPDHPHPAQPAMHSGEAWWICRSENRPLYRVGQGEVPKRMRSPKTWHKESHRAHKRRHR
jgi:hypothetical protein